MNHVHDARAQLRALADAVGGGESEFVIPGPPAGEDARQAAVLVLFGVLDSIPSDHSARAEPVSRDLDVLLLARASTLRSHAGQVAFPGGRIDPDDDGPVGAALREAHEETGLDTTGVEVLGMLPPQPISRSRHWVTPVLAWWRSPSPVRVMDEAESAGVFRVPVADLIDPANRGVTVIRHGEFQWRGPAFMVRGHGDDHLVWGFTAMVLTGLFDRLGWSEPWDDRREFPLETPR